MDIRPKCRYESMSFEDLPSGEAFKIYSNSCLAIKTDMGCGVKLKDGTTFTVKPKELVYRVAAKIVEL